jgi:hypothetical protein
MAKMFTLPVHSSEKGDLTVFENILPGSLNRILYITNADGKEYRLHRYSKAWHALLCVHGACNVYVESSDTKIVFSLDQSNKVLIIEPEDCHRLENLSKDAIVLVVSNESYDQMEYINEFKETH